MKNVGMEKDFAAINSLATIARVYCGIEPDRFRPAANGERDAGSVVVKEAMAMGLPVITTHFMGYKEMVTDETGFRVSPKDSGALACAIPQLAQMSEGERKAMGQAGRARLLELYTADRQARVLSEFVEAA